MNPSSSAPRIEPHHEAAARSWGHGGRAYDDISFVLSDALAHAAQRLDAAAGEEILDVATGTGWSARNAARRGARVTGVDIAPELLAAAAALSAHVEPAITFEPGDAERLPFPDRRFDGVISTFGVMFALGQERAAAELARVCRPGGRLVITAWTPAGSVAEFLGIIARHAAAPSPPASPLRWGDPAHAERLLGRDFELAFEPGINHAYHESEDHIWEWYTRGFGPLRELAGRLDAPALAALRADIAAYHGHYRTDLGLHVRREYLLIRGLRR
jgi:SAM-dependent methyltransferase